MFNLGAVGHLGFDSKWIFTIPQPVWTQSAPMCQMWWSGIVVSALAPINEVNQRRARLVLRWVTVSGFNSHCGTFISVCDQPPRSTQPGHPFVRRRYENQPKGSDALRLGSKCRYGCVWMAGKTVYSPCYTWAFSERFRDNELIYKALYKFRSSLLLTCTWPMCG